MRERDRNPNLHVTEIDRYAEILKHVRFGDWRFEVTDAVTDSCALRVVFIAPDNDTGRVEIQCGRWWVLRNGLTVSEVVTTALKAVLTAVEHEAREQFTYKGKPIFGPHWDVEELLALYEYRHAVSRVV